MKPEVASESSGSLEDPPGPLVKPACVDGMACICARWVSTPISLPSLLPQRKKKKSKPERFGERKRKEKAGEGIERHKKKREKKRENAMGGCNCQRRNRQGSG